MIGLMAEEGNERQMRGHMTMWWPCAHYIPTAVPEHCHYLAVLYTITAPACQKILRGKDCQELLAHFCGCQTKRSQGTKEANY